MQSSFPLDRYGVYCEHYYIIANNDITDEGAVKIIEVAQHLPQLYWLNCGSAAMTHCS